MRRNVALKLVSPKAGGSVPPTAARARLTREAQAMAKLSHPNVVSVFDVGEEDGRIFLAMEFVKGETLRSWLMAKSRPWREVLEKFLQAAEGLTAAHDSLASFGSTPYHQRRRAEIEAWLEQNGGGTK